MKPSEDVLDSCFELYQVGKLSEACERAEQAVQDSPDDGVLWQFVGLVRRDLKDFDGARQALETASMLVPLNPASQCALGESYARSGQIELAGDIFRNLASNPMCPTALLSAIAAGLGAIGDHETALDVCRELSRRDPSKHEALFGMAFYMRRLGFEAEAVIPIVRRAHEIAPQSSTYRVLLASLLANLGEYEEAADLIRSIPAGTVDCRCCLRRMMTIFQLAGERSLSETYREVE